LLVKLLSLLVIELLGVIQSVELKSLGKNHSCCQNRPSQGTTARLIHSCHRGDPPSVQLFLMKERRAPGLSVLGALLKILSRTFHRRRAGVYRIAYAISCAFSFTVTAALPLRLRR
jgi:hypothetical protein